MEGIPRIPVLSIDLKTAVGEVDIRQKLKQYIRVHYNEDANSYDSEISEFEKLREAAIKVIPDVSGCGLLKKYFSQLQLLKSRFPMEPGQPAAVHFTWLERYCDLPSPISIDDINFELASILHNIGALHSYLGSMDSRLTIEGMKVSCTHFQCAAWAFQHLRDCYSEKYSTDFDKHLLSWNINLMLAQAQECILEKSLMDNRKSSIISKVAMQIADFYKQCMTTLDISPVIEDIIGISKVQHWYKWAQFKHAYYLAITYYQLALQAEQEQKFGVRLAYCKIAKDKLHDACKLQEKKNEALKQTISFAIDVIDGKFMISEKENNFIYHEKVPNEDELTDIKGAVLVKGIHFDPLDQEISGVDIFARLMPIDIHKLASLYSEEKAKLLRQVLQKVEEHDTILQRFTSSLQTDDLEMPQVNEAVPQVLLECCAQLNVRRSAISQLQDNVKNLSVFHDEIELSLKEVDTLVNNYISSIGKLDSIASELQSESKRLRSAALQASQSNQEISTALNQHLENLSILSKPLQDLQKCLPELPSSASETKEGTEVKKILDKVKEMQNQRLFLLEQLRERIHSDQITKALIAQQDKDHEEIFAKELQKHQKTILLLDQNLSAQDNILHLLTKANANFAQIRLQMANIRLKHSTFCDNLVRSFNSFLQLEQKTKDGLDFYEQLKKVITEFKEQKLDKLEKNRLATSLSMKKKDAQEDVKSAASIQVNNENKGKGPRLKEYMEYYRMKKAGIAINPSTLLSGDRIDSNTIENCSASNYLSQANMISMPSTGQHFANPIPNATVFPHVSYDPALSSTTTINSSNVPAIISHGDLKSQARNLTLAQSLQYSQPLYDNLRQNNAFIEPNSRANLSENTSLTAILPSISTVPTNAAAFSDKAVSNAFALSNNSMSQSNCSQFQQPFYPVQQSGNYSARPFVDLSANNTSLSTAQQPHLQLIRPQLHHDANAASTLKYHGPYFNMPGAQTFDAQRFNLSQTVQPNSLPQQPMNAPAVDNLKLHNGFCNATPVNFGCTTPNIPTLDVKSLPQHGNININNNLTCSQAACSNYNPQHPVLFASHAVQQAHADTFANQPQSANYTTCIAMPNAVMTQINNSACVARYAYPQISYISDAAQSNQSKVAIDQPMFVAGNLPAPLEPAKIVASKPTNVPSNVLKPHVESDMPDISTIPITMQNCSNPTLTNTAQAINKLLSDDASKPDEVKLPASFDPFNDQKILQTFISDVEKFNKYVHSMNRKSLNGPTPLELKWKELCLMQDSDAKNHSISVARCYPDRNRFPEFLPFDENRVVLNNKKNDYINASLIKNFDLYGPFFIITESPLKNTVSDFWRMIFEQQIELIVLLASDLELKSVVYWPSERGAPLTTSSFTVTLQSVCMKEWWVQRMFTVQHTAANKQMRSVMQLQYVDISPTPSGSAWTTPRRFLSFIGELQSLHRQQRRPSVPVCVHCLNGVGRSAVLCVLWSAVQHIGRSGNLPQLFDWVASGRRAKRHFINEQSLLLFAYQTLLYHCEDILMKRGILTQKLSFSEAVARHPSQDFIVDAAQSLVTTKPATDVDGDGRARSSSSDSNRKTAVENVVVSDDVAQPNVERNAGTGESDVIVAANLVSSSAITDVLDDPNKFSLSVESGGIRRKQKITKADFFSHNSSTLTLDSRQPNVNDPLDIVDPLWAVKK